MSALFIHLFLLTVLFLAALYASQRKIDIIKSPFVWLSITFVAFVVGMQSNPNVDWYNYYDTISASVFGNYDLERLELIPRYLSVLIHYLGLPYYTWFVIMMWLMYLFVVLAANNGLKIIFPWLFFFFFLSLFSLSMIIIRQAVALTVILYAYTFIHQKKWIPYVLLIALAYCFHRTALICLPLYWIIPHINLKSIPLQVGIVCVAIVFCGYIVDFLWSLVPLGEEFRYAHYSELEFDYGEKSGIGVAINYLRYFAIILYSNKLKEKYNSYGFSIFYGLIFIDACVYNALKNDLALSRVELYFSVADFVTSGFLFHYLFRSKRGLDKVVFISLLALSLAVIVYVAWIRPDWQFV